jgi:hypothetical protein
MAYYKLDDAIREVKQGYARSLAIHGDWNEYTPWRVIRVVFGEVLELVYAVARRDRDGRHGIVNEMRDVAIVSMKALLWYRSRTN